jgi:hypothetical protein
MKLPMKISSLLLILLSVNLVACLGEETSAPLEISNSPNSDLVYCTDNPINTEALPTNYQIVYDDCIAWNGNTGTAVVRYLSNSATTTGLGVRVHFDSTSIQLTDVYAVLTTDVITNPENDDVSIDSLIDSDNDDDHDDNIVTDSFVLFAWGTSNVPANWPGMKNADLVTLTFEKVDNGNENYFLNYTASSSAAGYLFNP